MTHSRYAQLQISQDTFSYCDVNGIEGIEKLPVSLVVLVENVLRCVSDEKLAQQMARSIVEAGLEGRAGDEIEFMPARVLFQDFTGVPVFVDFAAMRDAAALRGGDPMAINPQIPCTLIVDHSVTADVVGTKDAAQTNHSIEAQRNAERFSFLKWSAKSFDNVRIVPPGVGICHQLNIERFCDVVAQRATADDTPAVLCFDTLVGTDSHTTTANGMGVLGWGVGGIEAEAAALNQPITMKVPSVVGVHLTGSLNGAASAMDVALTFAERLRAAGVVGCLVECFGEGLSQLSATQRATISNMTPEYGATATLFPADDTVLAQLNLTGHSQEETARIKAYLTAQGVFGGRDNAVFSRVIDINLSEIKPTLAGPSRPHNRVDINALPQRFETVASERGRNLDEAFSITSAEKDFELSHGALAIAAITSCTTATDPAMMIAAGLVARNAARLGCKPLPYVKKVLAPGSHATTLILQRAGLLDALSEVGFDTCGYGCMSCIGNSGEIFPEMHELSDTCELTSVLSGNRNFDGRISPDVSQNYLTQPALVVAYSLAGTMDINLDEEPVCEGAEGPVYLSDLLPSAQEVSQLLATCVDTDIFDETARGLFTGDAHWQALQVDAASTFTWDEDSTYVRNPPYFDHMDDASAVYELSGLRCLAKLGDFVTTDHISPAGAIADDSPAARYLLERGVVRENFNTYGSRRGNHEIMMRGCFANVKLENALAQGKVGGWTRNPYTGEIESIFDAACAASEHGDGLVILAGKLYGSGSSRDWAAKAPALLGVKAVIAESFERIHRSNLIGMGILPLQYLEGENAQTLGLDGSEVFSIDAVDFSDGMPAPATVAVHAQRADGSEIEFMAQIRVDTPTEGAYLSAGGILPFVLRGLMTSEG